METKMKSWNPWPISIVAFFTVAIAGCVSFVAFCNLHPADLVSTDYYEQEVRFQGQMDRVQRTQEMGQLATVCYNAAQKRITFSLPPDQMMANATGNIQLYRPSAAGLDQSFRLEVNSNGTQEIDAGALQPGLWKVKVSWTVGGKDYFLDQKVKIGS